MFPDHDPAPDSAARGAPNSSRRVQGASLIELVVAILVISISLTGVLLSIDTATRRSVDPMLERQSVSIAEAYLEEITQKSYTDPDDGSICPAPEAARALYDNLCDYDGLNDLGARDQSGSLVTGLEFYRIQISLDRSANLGGISGLANVVRIDAQVTDPIGRVVRLAAYRTSQ